MIYLQCFFKLAKVEVRLYKRDVHCFLCVTYDRAFFQPYDCSDRGHTAFVVECDNKSDLYKRYEKHFEYIWINEADKVKLTEKDSI